jgi:flavorubredoxin
MANLLSDMKALGVQKKTVAVIENGTWAPSAARLVRAELESMKDITVLDAQVTVKSALLSDSEAQLGMLAEAIVSSL